MLMSRSCVLLGFVVLAEWVMMPGLMMMMRCGVVVSGRLMMMLMRWMLRHLNFLLLELDIPPTRTLAATESSTGNSPPRRNQPRWSRLISVPCSFSAGRMAKDDEPIRPMTLGNMRQHGVRLFVTCGTAATSGRSIWTIGLMTPRCHRLARAL
jgi:hypothetical protein